MTESNIILMFIFALITVYLTPGPDMAMLLTIASTRGITAGIHTALGFAGARCIHVIASGMGLSVLFSRYPVTFIAARLIGAAYLLFVAYKTWKSGMAVATSDLEPSKQNSFLQGFITNLLNPKALIFCSVLLPQFLFSSQRPLLVQFAFLGIILVVVGFVFDSCYAFVAGFSSRILNNRILIVFQAVIAPIIFVLLALYLVVSLFL